MPKDTGIGASTKRVEDQRFLTGKGRYTSDINLVNQTHAVFVRSDVAHGSDQIDRYSRSRSDAGGSGDFYR